MDQLSWTHANVFRPTFVAANPWGYLLIPLLLTESGPGSNIRLLKKGKVAGPDELSPTFFKLFGDVLIKSLTYLLRDIWNEERIPL